MTDKDKIPNLLAIYFGLHLSADLLTLALPSMILLPTMDFIRLLIANSITVVSGLVLTITPLLIEIDRTTIIAITHTKTFRSQFFLMLYIYYRIFS